jgi:purine catabolism regulator
MTGPAITVKDVWRGALPSGTELLGGGAGLERRVEWACALRTRPPAFDAVKGGEMAFVPVAGIRLLDERLDLTQVMSSFAEKGGVAVAALGNVSAHSIDLADRLVMPLLRLPDGTNLPEAQQGCVRFIMDARTRLHERAAELQTALMQLALSGAGAAGIVDHVASLTSLSALWLDADGVVQHVASDELDLVSDAIAEQSAGLRRWADTSAVHAGDPPVRELALATSGQRALASPIPGRNGAAGFVVLVGADSELEQLARLAVSRAASACAIELSRERAVLETQERLEGEFVASLISGTYTSESAVVERARRLGVDLEAPSAVFVMRGTGVDAATWEQVLQSARTLLERREVTGLLTIHDHALAGIVQVPPDGGDAFVERHVDALRHEVQRGRRGISVSAGIGRAVNKASAVRNSHREAEQALALGRRVAGDGHTLRFAELGLHRLLSSLVQNPELHDFYMQTVGPLVAYDQRHGGELMTTLDAFFACHGSPTDTAERLKLHRNTVLYRLKRIEEIGGLRLDNPATRLNLHLCLRIRDVLPEALTPPRRAS